ncbi:MAG: hypothetical protein M1840_001407 [Geoglossum simile]|nr:MAG: hypothetical protein M1840_001407 [Geoglossum simile]
MISIPLLVLFGGVGAGSDDVNTEPRFSVELVFGLELLELFDSRVVVGGGGRSELLEDESTDGDGDICAEVGLVDRGELASVEVDPAGKRKLVSVGVDPGDGVKLVSVGDAAGIGGGGDGGGGDDDVVAVVVVVVASAAAADAATAVAFVAVDGGRSVGGIDEVESIWGGGSVELGFDPLLTTAASTVTTSVSVVVEGGLPTDRAVVGERSDDGSDGDSSVEEIVVAFLDIIDIWDLLQDFLPKLIAL